MNHYHSSVSPHWFHSFFVAFVVPTFCLICLCFCDCFFFLFCFFLFRRIIHIVKGGDFFFFFVITNQKLVANKKKKYSPDLPNMSTHITKTILYFIYILFKAMKSIITHFYLFNDGTKPMTEESQSCLVIWRPQPLLSTFLSFFFTIHLANKFAFLYEYQFMKIDL